MRNQWCQKMFAVGVAKIGGLTSIFLLLSTHGNAQVIINQPQDGKTEKVESPEPQDEELTSRRTRRYNGHWDVSFHMVFPHGDFHSSDIDNSGAGNALQGAGGSLGRYIPFKEGSNLGAYMSLGYFSNRIRGLTESLDEVLNDLDDETTYRIDDYNPRYEIMPASMGVAYESSFDKVNVYARLLVNLTGSFINRFSYRIDATEEVIMRYPLEWTTGYTVELGLNVGNELSLGVAWNYFGAAEFSPSPALQNVFLPGAEVLNDLNFQRRIQTLEVKLGYTFRHRDNR